MGYPVLVEGESGSGKTYSIKNFNPEEVGIFAVEKAFLPFKNSKGFKIMKNAGYGGIMSIFQEPKLKAYIIDDSQYLLVNELFDKAKDTGYGKFTDIALHFRNLIHYINHNIPDDVIVYFLHHTETDSTTGKIKAKTVGKMLDNQLTVEGCFSLVLLTQVEGTEHFFITQSDGYTTAKSPEGMFEDVRIPNDLKAVDTAIREYYGMTSDNADDKKGDKK
jgi:hypothetical protein